GEVGVVAAGEALVGPGEGAGEGQRDLHAAAAVAVTAGLALHLRGDGAGAGEQLEVELIGVGAGHDGAAGAELLAAREDHAGSSAGLDQDALDGGLAADDAALVADEPRERDREGLAAAGGQGDA